MRGQPRKQHQKRDQGLGPRYDITQNHETFVFLAQLNVSFVSVFFLFPQVFSLYLLIFAAICNEYATYIAYSL